MFLLELSFSLRVILNIADTSATSNDDDDDDEDVFMIQMRTIT